MAIKIIGAGSYLPEKVVTNADLTQWLDTSDEWIRQRVGIHSRHVANETETTFTMAEAAAQRALDSAGVEADQVGLILVATSTADYAMPSLACMVQGGLGVTDAIAFDISAACSGFIYALHVAQNIMQQSNIDYALVIGSESLSRVLNWQDRSTCVLFGDGAGAVVLKRAQQGGLLASKLHSDGENMALLNLPNGLPLTKDNATPVLARELSMQGNRVFRFAVKALGQVAEEVLALAHLERTDIDWFIPHQANARIIKAMAEKFDLPMEKVVLTLAKHGNTSAASIPLALDVAMQSGKIKPGHKVLFEAFGAGFVWGASIIEF